MLSAVLRRRAARTTTHRPSRGRAATAAAVSFGLLVTLLAAAPAGAGTVPGCEPDGTFYADAETVELAQAGTEVPVLITVRDSCDEVDTGFTGTLELVTADLGPEAEADLTVVPLEFTVEDAGVATADVPVDRRGLVYVDVVEPATDELVGFTSLYVFGADRLPYVDYLDVLVDGGTYRAAGTVVDPDAPEAPVTVTVELDSREVLRLEADDPDEEYEFGAPPSVGSLHRFDTSVAVPAGRHSLCLFVVDRLPGGGTRTVNVECRVVEVAGPPPTGVRGGYDVLARVPQGVVAAGWALDGSKLTAPTTVQVVGTFFLPGVTRGFTGRPSVRTADRERPDIGLAFPALGSRHGFVSDSFGGDTGTVVELCVKAGDTLLDLGCRRATLRRDPVGALDGATPVRGGAVVSGWAVDEDTYDALDVHVYVDGAPTAVLRADGYRADVAAVFPDSAGGLVRGYGGSRGYSAPLAMPAGPHQVCAYGINVDQPFGQGRNALLGCRTVVVPPSGPVGAVDAAVPAPGGFALRGWTLDADDGSAAVDVHTYRDGTGVGITRADQQRPDLVAVEGGRYGTRHGFTTGTISTGARATVCAYAINVGPGSNTTLRCLDLTRSLTPTGAFDSVSRSLLPGVATVRGWALDPDTGAPVDVHLYVDGRLAGVTSASTSRPDVGAAFPGWGAGHGWSLDVRAAPGQQVCSYAINTAQGTGNTTLGCRTA